MKRVISLFLSAVVAFVMLAPNMVKAGSLTAIIAEKYYSINILESYGIKEVLFIPASSGNYTIYSTGNLDSKVVLYDDKTSEILAENDDANGVNFSLSYDFEKDVVYRLRFTCYGETTGTFYVKVVPNSLTGENGSVNINPKTTDYSIPFTPSKSGVFRFYSTPTYSDKVYDTKFVIKNSAGQIIAQDDDHGAERNFAVSCFLTKDQVYTLVPGFYNSGDYNNSNCYTLNYEAIYANALTVSKAGFYYIGDDPDTGLTVMAQYPSYYEDTYEKRLYKGEYKVSCDTSTAGKNKTLTVSTYASQATTLVTVKTPSIYVTIGDDVLYPGEDVFPIDEIEVNATAVTAPEGVEVFWESSAPSLLNVEKVDKKTGALSVKQLFAENIVVTAYYIYNDKRYECPFEVIMSVAAQSARVVEKKTEYSYGDPFQLETLEVVFSDKSGRTFSQVVTAEKDGGFDSLTKKTPGKHKRTAKYKNVYAEYEYTVRCATPKITSVKSISGSQQNIKWNKATGAKGYYVYMSTSKNGKYTEIGSTTGTTFVSTDLKANKTYYYKVKAYYNSNSAYDSDFSSAVGKKTLLATPVISSVTTNSSSQQTIKWGKVSGATSYEVYITSSKNGTYKKLGSTTSTSYKSKNLSANKTYYYRVVAKNKNGSSAFSQPVSGKTLLTTPKISSVTTNSSSQQTIKWGKINGAEKYYVYRATSKDGKYTKIATTTSTSYVCKKLTANKTYYYKIVAVNSTGKSATSSAVGAKTKLATPKISSVTTNSSKQQTVKWSAVSGAKGYHVYRATSKTGKYTKIGSTTAKSFISTGLKSKTTYYYKVIAYTSKSDSKTNSAASSPVGAKTK